MNNKKIIYMTLLGVLFLAALLKGISSNYILNFVKNINYYDSLEKYELKNADTKDLKKERYVLLYDENNGSSVDIKDNLSKVLNYMDKDILESKVSELKYINKDMDGYIVCLESLEKIAPLNDLMNYVKNGGSVLFAERPLNEIKFNEIKDYIGIERVGEFKDALGLEVVSDFMLGAKGYNTKEDFIVNSSLDVVLKKEAKVHLKDSEGLPLLWEHQLGKGRVVIFNGTMLEEKLNRGVISGAISLMRDNFIYPIVNSKVFFIDDFPAPIPSGKNDIIYKEYRVDTDKFYRDIWWSDLIKYSKVYDVKYSGMIIESYNDNTKSSFISNEHSKDKNDLLLYGRELIRSGGELGIHGYNHQSLAPKGYIKEDLGYNSWESQKYMEESLKEASRYIRDTYPEYEIRSYVPPSNILSTEGREAIKVALPQVKILSSLYIGGSYNDSYVQEFQVAKDGIIEFPRFTAGYEGSDELYWTLYNGVNFLGIVSHFVHPDDVLDLERNSGKSWSRLTEEFKGIFKNLKEKYPWLRAMKVSNAGEALKNYLAQDMYFQYKDDYIIGKCNNFRKEAYLLLSTTKKLKEATGCELISLGEKGYIIKATSPEFSIKFLK